LWIWINWRKYIVLMSSQWRQFIVPLFFWILCSNSVLFFLCTHCIIHILSLSRHILNIHSLMYVYTKFMTSPYTVLHSCSIFTYLSGWHVDQRGLFIMGILNFDCMLGIGTQHDSVAWFYNICLIKPYNLKLYPVWRISLHGMRVRSVACFCVYTERITAYLLYVWKNMKNNRNSIIAFSEVWVL